MSASSTDDSQHVVEAHESVGGNNGAHSRKKGIFGFYVDIFIIIGSDEFNTNKDQQDSTDGLKIGNLQQPDDSSRHEETQDDSPAGPVQNGLLL